MELKTLILEKYTLIFVYHGAAMNTLVLLLIIEMFASICSFMIVVQVCNCVIFANDQAIYYKL